MSKSKAKGTAWETAIVTYLHTLGLTSARRVTLTGANDQADIHLGAVGEPLSVIEAKNEQRVALAEYVDEVNEEAGHCKGAPLAVAWVHRRGKSSPADGYVIMDGRTYARIVATLGDGFGNGMLERLLERP